MSKKKTPTGGVVGVEEGPTGLLIPCPVNGFPFPAVGVGRALGGRHRPVALTVQRGPKRFWAQCRLCYTRICFGTHAWSPHFGMTPDQARAAGLESPM